MQDESPPQVLDYHQPPAGEKMRRLGENASRLAFAILRIGSRAGLMGQVCIAHAVFFWLMQEPKNVAIGFWRQEAVAATLLSFFWLSSPRNEQRGKAFIFLAANFVGLVVAALLPTLIYN